MKLAKKVFEMQTIQPEIPEILEGNENGTNFFGKKFPKICVYLERLSYFPENSENVDPLVTRISQNPNMKFLVECEGQINSGDVLLKTIETIYL